MNQARSLWAAMLLGWMAVCAIVASGCTSTKTAGEPPVETAALPVVDQTSILAMGPPPGYVKPENYWVREKIILGVASAPETPATPKSTGKKGKHTKKTAKN
jgi:hypothetical protein